MNAPASTPRSPRAAEIVAAARWLLESEGVDAVTMRAVADRLGIQAPSLYKHFRDKHAIEVALVEAALTETGEVLHASIVKPDRRGRIVALLGAYRRHATANPNLYRLATTGPLDRDALPAGLEDWAGEPFLTVTGDPFLGQALWSFAHGMVILEIDDRFPDGSDLARTWRSGAAAFGDVLQATT